VAEHPSIAYGTAYNAGSGVAVSIGQTIDILREITGCNKQIITDQARFRPGNSEVMTLLADSQKLNTATGWQSEVTLQLGLEKTVDWWKGRISEGLVRPDTNYLL
jgi:UDP-glucose 4-epimerase